jgi:hypothetical protein
VDLNQTSGTVVSLCGDGFILCCAIVEKPSPSIHLLLCAEDERVVLKCVALDEDITTKTSYFLHETSPTTLVAMDGVRETEFSLLALVPLNPSGTMLL